MTTQSARYLCTWVPAYTEKWNAARTNQRIPDIKEFSWQIKKIGDQHDLKNLTAFGENMLMHVNNFDIEQIFKSLDAYPVHAETIKQFLWR